MTIIVSLLNPTETNVWKMFLIWENSTSVLLSLKSTNNSHSQKELKYRCLVLKIFSPSWLYLINIGLSNKDLCDTKYPTLWERAFFLRRFSVHCTHSQCFRSVDSMPSYAFHPQISNDIQTFIVDVVRTKQQIGLKFQQWQNFATWTKKNALTLWAKHKTQALYSPDWM